MNIDYYFPHWGPFVQKVKLAQPLIDELLIRGRAIKGRVDLDNRDSLAGVLDHEYRFPGGKDETGKAQKIPEDIILPDSTSISEWAAIAQKIKGPQPKDDKYEDWFVPKFKSYVDFYVEKMEEHSEMHFVKKPYTWFLESLWINFQHAGDFQPPHLHDGHLSFVIYLQFPKEIAEENKKTKGDRNNAGPGAISFIFGEAIDFSKSVVSWIPEEGDMVIFPAWLKHYVHPFNSDVERISVSGNLKFNLLLSQVDS